MHENVVDVEKRDILRSPDMKDVSLRSTDGWTKRLLLWGVEIRGEFAILSIATQKMLKPPFHLGIWPVPPEERTDTQFFKIFFIWFTANFNILSFSAGTLGPVAFGLGVRDTCLVIFFFNLFCCAMPAYL